MEESGWEQVFGCERCWPADAGAAWEARRAHALVADLIDEPHWHVMILACPDCGQRFVSIFAETIDWVDGDDPQFWSLLPISGAEALDLVLQGYALTEAGLSALGRGRRCLRLDHPKGTAPHIYWTTGVSIDHHD